MEVQVVLYVVVAVLIVVGIILACAIERAAKVFEAVQVEISSARAEISKALKLVEDKSVPCDHCNSTGSCPKCHGDGEKVVENPLVKSIRKTLDAGVNAR